MTLPSFPLEEREEELLATSLDHLLDIPTVTLALAACVHLGQMDAGGLASPLFVDHLTEYQTYYPPSVPPTPVPLMDKVMDQGNTIT